MVSTSKKAAKKRMPKHPLHALLPHGREGKDVSTVLLEALTVRRMFSLLDYLGILTRFFPVVNKYLQNFFDKKRSKPTHVFVGADSIRPPVSGTEWFGGW